MKTSKTIQKLTLALLALFAGVNLHADTASTVPTHTEAEPVISVDTGEKVASSIPAVPSEDDSEVQELLKALKRLPATVFNSFVAGVALNEGKKWGLGDLKAYIGKACLAALYAGSRACTFAAQATAQGLTCVKNGTALAQVGSYIGSYGEPESAEALYDAVQVVQNTLNGGVYNASAVTSALCSVKQGLGLLPTNGELLHSALSSQGAYVAAVAVGTVVACLAVKKAIETYKKK